MNVSSLVVSVLLCCFMTGCDETKAFRGDGDLVYLPKPGLLGTDGYALRFPSFPVSNDYSVSYSFTNLPVRQDSYRLYLIPDDHIPTTDLESAHISVLLTEAGGAVHLDISNNVSDWIASSHYVRPTQRYREFWLTTSRTDLNSASFRPMPQLQYELKISYRCPTALQTSTGVARFELRCMAGK